MHLDHAAFWFYQSIAAAAYWEQTLPATPVMMNSLLVKNRLGACDRTVLLRQLRQPEKAYAWAKIDKKN
jgi:hypothetical protein